MVEVKYVGIGYVRRVVEGLKESIPKMVGELLIGRVLGEVKRRSFGEVEGLVAGKGQQEGELVRVEEGTLLTLRKNQEKLEKINMLIRYFCLKVDSQNIIPNINERIENYLNNQDKIDDP